VENIRRVAFEIVFRACSFGLLAIICVMVGMSFEPRAALQAGGILTLMMTGILVLKAHEALTKHYRRTEMWLYLPEDVRPPATVAQQVTSTVMRETYLIFALWTAEIALGMWLVALVFWLAGL
jgi:hypothetical protein